MYFALDYSKQLKMKKNLLRSKEASGVQLTNADSSKLEFYRKRGAVLLLCGAIGECLETISGKVITNKFRLSFSEQISPHESAKIWSPTVGAISGLHIHLDRAFSDGLKNQERVRETLRAFSQLIASLGAPFEPLFEKVKANITQQ